jgi:hypothetical protein
MTPEPSNKRMQLTKRGLRLGGRFRELPSFIESRFAADPQCYADMGLNSRGKGACGENG